MVALAPILVCLLAGPATAQESAIEFSTTEGTWMSLDVSPDGRSLVFELLGDIYALPLDGGRARPILAGRPFQSQPRFSPDGTRLVYVSDESGADNLWISSADGKDARALTTVRRALMLSPAWSRDGRTVWATVIEGPGPRAAAIWQYDVDSGKGTRVVENANGAPAPLVSSPAPGPYGAWPSADGGTLYYTSVTPRPYGSRSGASSTVLARELATGRTRAVALGGFNPMKPAISNDGRWLVYAALNDGVTGLRGRDLRTGAERWLHRHIDRHQLEGRATRDVLPNFAITPDGRAVVIAFGGKIHRLGLDDGSHRVIPFEAPVSLAATRTLDFPRRVDMGPVRARRIQHLAIAGDGRVAFSTLARIFVATADGRAPTRLTRADRPREFMPAWSPDGRWVAFVTWDEAGGHLWKARADGRGAALRLSAAPALWVDPVWTADGSAIVAVTAPLGSTRASPALIPPDSRVVAVPAEGGAVRDITDADGFRHPHFTRDGDRLYLSSAQAGLVSVRLDGTDRRVEARLARDAGPGDLWMGPDARHVAALLGTRLLRFDLPPGAGPGVELKATDGVPITDRAPASATWTPDGGGLAWVTGTMLSRVGLTASAGDRQDVRLQVEVPRPVPAGTVVLRGAKVLTMRGYEIVADADVMVHDTRIAGIGPRGTLEVPPDATIVDVAGKVIVPGFIDVHAHLFVAQDLLQPESTSAFANLAFGVTTVRDPQAPPDIFAVSDIVEADAVPSPRIFSTGPGIALGLSIGGNYLAPDFRSIDEVRRALLPYRDEYGTHLLKSYLLGDRQQRQWVVEASRELGMMPTTEGGADTKADLTHALDGFSGNEHALPVAPIHDDVVQLVARTGIAYTPTVVVAFGAALPTYRLLAEERPHENPRIARWFAEGELFQRTSTRLLWFPPEDYHDIEVSRGANAILKAGGRVALGGHGELQGLSNHWEMALLARGGMAAHDVLRVATIFGAEAIGYGADLGSLEPGKLADLVVLDRDPLSDIRATTSIRYVMRGGVLYEAETLEQVWPRRQTLAIPWWLARDEVRPGGVGRRR